ncbi:acetyltransferase, GNAT family [Pseudovibrio sp. FO-BEG1]|uniref:GNAT family N-acetyltransferase n=1 Tax=Pseudovibrio sp. (strain FO-BEG1) TaxID=911045 RepID=UPI000238BE2D|nr:N-acetyltransferase [Pseudovibrio sp. FO-BEG1]AEV39407.1 acetyltransferase, GNAT family [Pseudovibrio sp. FO-BEG1]
MIIRAELPSDIEIIRDLVYAAFENHPHHEPGAKPTEHLIVDQLRENGELSLSLIAGQAGGMVGHIAFSPITIDGEDKGWYGLGPVAIVPKHQGKGFGAALIMEGMLQIRQRGAKGVVLLGEPKYYSRFGFQQAESLTFPGVPAEYFMQHTFEGETPTGTVAYSEAFSAS